MYVMGSQYILFPCFILGGYLLFINPSTILAISYNYNYYNYNILTITLFTKYYRVFELSNCSSNYINFGVGQNSTQLQIFQRDRGDGIPMNKYGEFT